MTKVEEKAVAKEVSALDEMARRGAQRMIEAAMEVEVEQYVTQLRGHRDERGHAQVVRNGRGQERTVTVGAGTMQIRAPRVNDKRVIEGERQRFVSQILPPYLRRSKNVSELLPLLYLRGLSTGDFREALPVLLGEDAAGLSPSSITRLVSMWQEEYAAWKKRSLADRDYVYVWVDGVHFGVRLEDERLCALVMIGARPDGTKELIALEDGFRESKDSWAELLRDVSKRGMRAPEVAIGDGALGFWAAVREVWPATREERCWVHKIANVLDKLPRSLQPKAKSKLHEAMNAPSKVACDQAIADFVQTYQAKYPKAAASLLDGRDKLVTHFDFPAEHWQHLRTTNPVESTFATVKLRQRVTKGAGSRAAGLAMAFKLLLAAERTWRRLNGHELLPLVRAHVVFRDGERLEREEADDESPTVNKGRTKKSEEKSEKDAA
jgi:putative transposase